MKGEVGKRLQGGKPDENLGLEYKRFVATRKKELESRSHTENIANSLDAYGNNGKMAFLKTVTDGIASQFRYPIYPDPHFFDR